MPVHVPVYMEPTFLFIVPVKKIDTFCDCDVMDMEPVSQYKNFKTSWFDNHCNRPIAYSNVIEYNQYHGYSGFDEVADCE